MKELCISYKFHIVGFIKEDLSNLKRIETLKNLKITKREKKKKMEKLSFSQSILKRKEALWSNELILFEEALKLWIKIPEKMEK